MKRRNLLLLSTALAVVTVVALAAQRPTPRLLVLEWAGKASGETPPTAILIELGLKDLKARDWSGHATVSGAKVVHREGYRFRTEDKLTDPNGWQASSHRGMRVPPKNPAVSKMVPIATVGVVLHLADVTPEASLTVESKDKSAEKVLIPLKEVLTGRTVPFWNGEAAVRLVSTATAVAAGKTEDDFPAAAYGPDGTLWVAYISYTVRDESRRIEAPQLKQQPEDFKALYKPGFADQLFVKYYRSGKWSEPIAITGPKEDLVRCAIAVEANGDAWVIFSAHRQGKHQIYGRPISKRYDKAGGVVPRPGPEHALTTKDEPNLSPLACTTQAGKLGFAYQSWGYGAHATLALHIGRNGRESRGIGGGQGNAWGFGIAAGPNGETTVAYDVYEQGDYDIGIHVVKGLQISFGSVGPTTKFEARPSIAYDPRGRLWIAYEEGPERWGKDYGSLVPNRGDPLYSARSVKVVCIDTDGTLKRPVAELPVSTVKAPTMAGDALVTNTFEKASRWAYPKIGIDGKGRVWLTYRRNFGSRYSSHPGAYWITFARRLDGDRWSEEIELHHSDGLLDSRPVLLPHQSGGLLVVHNTDGRYTTPEVINNDIYLSHVTLPGEPVEPKLVPHDPGRKDPKLLAKGKEEAAAVQRIRAYHVEAGGKKYRLLRGEFHRHTEISWDGSPDGSLEDMFRYAIDAASMDWIGNGDHDNGGGREYPWWLTQKFNDAYRVAGRFTPMFTYERSVSYPHGHRNCMFAQRGVLTLPRLAPPPGEKKAPGGVHPDDTKMLYRYLHEMNGICASHTSATGMGTDWRDNDPKAEPVVEIYQGDRMSYEMEGAPRSGYDPKTGASPANIAGWFPKGFINNALDKGYRLGFQASSDHWSTHISFFVVLAERNDRKSILDAVKKRHTYAATDNIIVDLRSGDHVMGDEFTSSGPPTLEFTVIGTDKLAKVHILKDSKIVHTIQPGGREYRGKWTTPAEQGTHHYYLRVEQADGELAWASPLWIRQGP